MQYSNASGAGTELASGILVANSHVLTAAHIFGGATAIKVYFMYDHGSSTQSNASVSSILELQGTWSDPNTDVGKDIAVIKLQSPFSLPESAFLGLRPRPMAATSSGWPWTRTGTQPK